MKKWLCVVCGLIYDEAAGWPDDGIAPGTRWEDVPEDWTCPDCGVGKEDFEMLEINEEETPVTAAPEVSQPSPAAVAAASAAVSPHQPPIVIIGSGHAGYSLAAALRKRDANAAIVVFTEDDGADYAKPGLSNAMARGKTADALVTATAQEMQQRHHIQVHSHSQVQSIAADKHLISTAHGEQAYSKLVLATGAEAIRLPLAGDGVADMLSVNSLSGYRVLRERLDSGTVRNISIIGNGLVGCEFANELIAQGYEVSVIGLTYCLDTLLPEIISRDLEQKLRAAGVQWYLDNSVQSITRSDGAYQLSLSKGQTVAADLVLSAVGLRPRTALAEAAGITCRRGIVVDETLQTSAADVFALGDCAEVNGRVLPFIAPITYGVKALAETLSGYPAAVRYPLMPVVVKTPALPLLILPPPPGTAGTWQVQNSGRGMRGLFVDNEHLIVRGFVLSGELVSSERQQWMDAVNAGHGESQHE
jgi:rubredoxin-NAD+ reductase